jgi:hypothetical protein
MSSTVHPAQPIAGSIGGTQARALPVKIWATIGAVLLAVNVYSVTRWITSDTFRPAPLGTSVIPPGELHALWFFQTVSTIAGGIAIWKLLIAPWRRDGRISWDGMLVIAFFAMWVWDPLTNVLQATWWYNGYEINMSSWATYIPGWVSPGHENFVEPIFLMGPCYIWFFILPTMLGCFIMRRIKQYFPQAGGITGLFCVFLAMAIFDAIVEIYFVRTGAGAYPGVVRSLSIWPGTPLEWPLYEGAIMGWTLTAFAALRYFRDDKGFSFVERGADKLALPAAGKTFVRFLAIVGVTHSIYLILYFVPWNAFALHIDTSAPMPSYMRHGVCGEGTVRACPTPFLPIQTKSSIPISPDDPSLPPDVRAAQNGPPYSFWAYQVNVAPGAKN